MVARAIVSAKHGLYTFAFLARGIVSGKLLARTKETAYTPLTGVQSARSIVSKVEKDLTAEALFPLSKTDVGREWVRKEMIQG